MYCKKCGTKLREDAEFCSVCGAPVRRSAASMSGQEDLQKQYAAEDENTGYDEPNYAGDEDFEDPEYDSYSYERDAEYEAQPSPRAKRSSPASTRTMKPMPKPAIIALVGGAVFALVMIVFAASGAFKPTVNLNDYLMIEASGYDGYGTVDIAVDWSSIDAKYGSKIKLTKEAQDKFNSYGAYGNSYTNPLAMQGYEAMTGTHIAISILKNGVKVSANPINRVSNGQKISYKWAIDQKGIEKYLNCRVKYSNEEWTVSGLEDLSTIDPPIPVSYVTEAYEIDSESLNAMHEQAVSELNAKIARTWEDPQQLVSIDYAGLYLLTNKDDKVLNASLIPTETPSYNSRNILSGNANRLYLVYKITAHPYFSNNNGTYDQEINYYWYRMFRNLAVKSDGTVDTSTTDGEIPYDIFSIDTGVQTFWGFTQTFDYNGYKNLDDLYSKVVTQNADVYNCEDLVS